MTWRSVPRVAAATAPLKARHVIGDNAALIAGLGIAIGGIIAAAFPETRAEAQAMGRASDSMKQAAADAAAKSVSEADLGSHASRMTQNMADTVKEAADNVLESTFSPSRTPNT